MKDMVISCTEVHNCLTRPCEAVPLAVSDLDVNKGFSLAN
jgi:hypothetical protein